MATGTIERSDSLRQSLKMASFAHVDFCNVPESYISDADVECSYVVSKQLEATSRDWIGVYKVGWRVSSDYIYYDWSPLPADYTTGNEFTGRITFPASKLPKDDGEFYQFCYVSGSGQVRGASSPFQFKHPMTDDFIEIEDENGELLVVRSKTAVLEEQLKKANDIRMELRQKLGMLENERALVSFEMRELEKKLAEQRSENEMLLDKLRESVDRNADLQQENKDLQVCVRCLQEKMEVLNQEKLSMEKRLDDSDVYIVSLQEKIKNLVTEKDGLAGTKKALEEEKEQLQRRAESSDKQHEMVASECEQLSTRLSASEASRRALHIEINELRHSIEVQTRRVQQHTAAKETVVDLTEALHNAEDKLEAAELSKKMLNEEVLALRQAYEQMSSNLEMSKGEAESAKRHLKQLESRCTEELTRKQQELEKVSSMLENKEMEIKMLTSTIVELRRQMTDSSQHGATDDDAMVALQTALTTLTERFAKLTRRNDELTRNYEQATRRLEELEGENRQEIANLKYRLELGKESYKDLFVEKLELQKEVDRLSSTGRCNAEETSTGGAGKSSREPVELDVTGRELVKHMAEIQQEMEKRNERASKYKHLYWEEKKKYDSVNAQLQQLLASREKVQSSLPSTPQRIAQSSSSSREPSIDRETLSRFDPLAQSSSQSCLTTPLKPLPPPMQPEILPSAKVASVKAQLGSSSSLGIVVVKLPDGSRSVYDMNADIDPSTAADEDKFVDAPSEPMIPAEPPQQFCDNDGHSNAAEGHLDDYFEATGGFVCPVCGNSYPPSTYMRDFTFHVNAHFDDN